MDNKEKSYVVGENLYTESDRQMIKSVFKDNADLLKLIRKVFIPAVDPESSGSLTDVYFPIPFEELSPDDCKIFGMARNLLIKHLNLRINALWALANTEPKTAAEIAEQNKKNSNK